MLHSVEPQQSLSFQVTWEITLKCNLDCSYCGDGHNNKLSHPSLEECLKTADFLLEYVDLYLSQKKTNHATFNIYGGEGLFHPNIVEILNYVRSQHKDKFDWKLNIGTITNAVVKEKIWDNLVDLIDYFTVSYHSESTQEQQDLVRRNLLVLKNKNKGYNCAIMMHPKKWNNCIDMVNWCEINDIKYLPRQLDHDWDDFQFYYNKSQASWLRGFYSKNDTTNSCDKPLTAKIKDAVSSLVNLNNEGRTCCGGAALNVNCDYEHTQLKVNNQFKGWSCGVNYFFVFVKQVTKEIFVNRDCRMNFQGKVGPIGNLDNSRELLDSLRHDLLNESLPTIVCQKTRCRCGICTPKASTESEYKVIMEKYIERRDTLE